MDHKVIGTTMPVLEMQLAAGESDRRRRAVSSRG